MNNYNEIINFIDEIQYTLSQILNCGFKSCHEHTIKELNRLSIIAENYGLLYAYKKLILLSEQLENKRHTFDLDFMELSKESCKLNEYCLICKKELQILNVEENFRS